MAALVEANDHSSYDECERTSQPLLGVIMHRSALRHAVAGILMFVLALAGVGRGLVAASETGPQDFGIPGLSLPFCHSDGGGSAPAGKAHHDCCDACALSAPATLADAPSVSGPASVMHYVEHAEAMVWVPTVARLRSPRQSQGPPAA